LAPGTGGGRKVHAATNAPENKKKVIAGNPKGKMTQIRTKGQVAYRDHGAQKTKKKKKLTARDPGPPRKARHPKGERNSRVLGKEEKEKSCAEKLFP